jgi:hypothetical protein
MRDDVLPEDELLRPLYEATPSDRLRHRVLAAPPRMTRRSWFRGLADPARPPRYRPVGGALTMAMVVGVAGAAVGVHSLSADRSGANGATNLAGTSCNPGAGLETPVSDPTSSAASATSTFGPDNEAGLSDSQREALHKQGWSNFQHRYTAWVKSLKVDKVDLHSLPRHPLNTLALPGQPSLRDAVAKADVIVVGCVSAIRPRTSLSGTNTTFSVEQTVKGSSISNVTFTQSGFLFPTADYSGAVILQSADGALLLPGERAVLLLQKSSSDGYVIQSVSGWYQVVNGVVRSNGFNRWGESVDGRTEGDFVQMLKAGIQ